MKRIFSIFCTVALLYAFMLPVGAAENLQVAFGSYTSTVEANGTVELPVQLISNPGITSFEVVLSYSDGLTIDSAPKQTGLSDCSISYAADLTQNPYKLGFDSEGGDSSDGEIFTIKFKAPSKPGTYQIKMKLQTVYDLDVESSDNYIADGGTAEITVIGSSEHTAKWNVTGGKVYASATEWTDGDVTLTDGATGIKTTGDVYFYFFPDAGYTTTGMTIDGETVISGGTVASKKCTLTADKTFNIAFAEVSNGTPETPTAAVVESASADGVTIFGTAAKNAKAFGALVGLSNDVAANHGYMFAAEAANGDGQFAIVLEGIGMFDTAKSYAAKVYATNNGTTEYSSSATDITY